MGTFSHKRRSQARILSKTLIHSDSSNKCQCPRFRYFTVGGRQIIKKRCSRTCPSRKDADRFLFNIFSCSQKIGRNETSYQSKTAEQVSAETALQNGLLKQGHESGSVGRLGNINRSERGIPTHASPYITQEVPSFLHSGERLSIHVPIFWSKPSTKKFHKNCNGNSGTSQRLSVYLDDWFLVNQIREMLIRDKIRTLNLLAELGFLVNLEKSTLCPSQNITYIGTVFLLERGIVCPTLEKIRKIQDAIQRLKQEQIFSTFLGLMASEIIPHARLFMRPIQLHLLHFW